MKNHFKSFGFFKSTLSDPLFEVQEILSDKSHAEHENLKLDFENIDNDLLNLFVVEKKIDRYLSRWDNKDEGRRTFYLICKLQDEIAKQRLIALASNTTESLPFIQVNPAKIEILENSLVSTKDFSAYDCGFQFQDYIYHLTPSTSASNSSYWISQTIITLITKQGLNFKIRLDPFIEKHITDYHPIMNKMTVYGRSLDWNRLKSLKLDEHGRWLEDTPYSRISFTDFVWHPNDDEIHFTCEELPKIEDIGYRGSRYFHAIFEKGTGLIKHCDGAIRIYTKQEFEKRLNFHVKDFNVRKIGQRVKVFQLDEAIDQETFSLLIVNFMVWNEDVFFYFNQ